VGELADVLSKPLDSTAESVDLIDEVFGDFPAKELRVDFDHPVGEGRIERGDEESIVEKSGGSGEVL